MNFDVKPIEDFYIFHIQLEFQGAEMIGGFNPSKNIR